MAQNLISSLAWVSRGYAAKVPREHDFQEVDIEEMKQHPRVNKNLTADLGKIQEQDEDSEESGQPVFCKETETFAKQTYDDDYPVCVEEMSDEEKEDYQIKSSDALIIAAKIENEFSSLEIYIYEEEKANLFVHHEIQLSAFPLAVEWLSIQPSQIEQTTSKGNYAIVASFLPEIEIWDLDVVNVLEPTVILGGETEQNYKKPKNFKKAQRKFKSDSHQDSVISLCLNKFKPNILLSGSADHTVKLWDIAQQKCVFTYNHHKNKLQVTKFNTKEESILLSVAEDMKLCIFDARTPQEIHSHQVLGSVEGACWDPSNGYNIIYSTEKGDVVILDARKITDQPLAHFNSSKKAVSSVSMSADVPGLLATTCLDGKIRVYDTHSAITNGKLSLVSQYNPKLDSLYCGQFYQDSPWTFACGSSKGELFAWDMSESQKIVNQFANRLPSNLRPNVNECTQDEEIDICMKQRNEVEMMEQEDMGQEDDDEGEQYQQQ